MHKKTELPFESFAASSGCPKLRSLSRRLKVAKLALIDLIL